jgi:hypothetical protein
MVHISPDAWGDTATVNFQNGILLVRANQQIQEAVAGLLSDLRRHVGIQIDVEARFLKVDDNFLQDIGVDFRGLGDNAAEGEAGRGLENPRTFASMTSVLPSSSTRPPPGRRAPARNRASSTTTVRTATSWRAPSICSTRSCVLTSGSTTPAASPCSTPIWTTPRSRSSCGRLRSESGARRSRPPGC